MSFGAGVAYRVYEQWSIRGDWDRFRNIGATFDLTLDANGRFENVDLFTLGLSYEFR